MSASGLTFFAAAFYWTLTALYGALASQAFVQEQFLAPRLFAPLARFADWHLPLGLLVLVAWMAPRWKTPERTRTTRVAAAASIWVLSNAGLALRAPLTDLKTTSSALLVVGAGVVCLLAIAAAEVRSLSGCSAATGERLIGRRPRRVPARRGRPRRRRPDVDRVGRLHVGCAARHRTRERQASPAPGRRGVPDAGGAQGAPLPCRPGRRLPSCVLSTALSWPPRFSSYLSLRRARLDLDSADERAWPSRRHRHLARLRIGREGHDLESGARTTAS